MTPGHTSPLGAMRTVFYYGGGGGCVTRGFAGRRNLETRGSSDLSGAGGIHISDVKLPPDVEPVISDRDFTIATIAAPTIQEEEEPEEEEGEGLEGEEGEEIEGEEGEVAEGEGDGEGGDSE